MNQPKPGDVVERLLSAFRRLPYRQQEILQLLHGFKLRETLYTEKEVAQIFRTRPERIARERASADAKIAKLVWPEGE